jgi:hypothetical protein
VILWEGVEPSGRHLGAVSPGVAAHIQALFMTPPSIFPHHCGRGGPPKSSSGCVLLMVQIGVPGYAAERPVPMMTSTGRRSPRTRGQEEEGSGTSHPADPGQPAAPVQSRLWQDGIDEGQDEGSLVLAFSNSAAVTRSRPRSRSTTLGLPAVPTTPGRLCRHIPRRIFLQYRHPRRPGSEFADVWAIIGLFRGSDMRMPTDVLLAISIVGHCTNADCNESVAPL